MKNLLCWWRLTAFPHHNSRSFAVVSYDTQWKSYASAFNSQLTVHSSQLTADSFYLLTAFLTMDTDPSHSLRMTFNVSLIMTPCRPVSFWTEARKPCGKDGKWNGESEWRIYASDDVLPLSLITVIDPSLPFRMTPYRLIQGSWSRPSEGSAGTRSTIEDTRLS